MGDTTRAAVALIHCALPEPAVLLMRRAERDDDPWSGHWALPGGRREGEESTLACARRETLEEIGLRLGEPDERLADSMAGSAVGAPIEVAVYRWCLDARPQGLAPDAREVAALHWLPCALLADRSLHEERIMAPRLPDKPFPCLPVIEPPLWGFTYRVLCRWWCAPQSAAGE